jgi:microcystin-dependent protein
MASTFDNNLRLREMGTGDESGTWGARTNENLELIAEAFSYQTEATFSSDANATATIADGSTDKYRAMYVKVTSGVSLTATRTLTIAPNTVSKMFIIENATSGSQSISIAQGSGGAITIPNGNSKVIFTEGTGSGAGVIDGFSKIDLGSSAKISNKEIVSIDGTQTLTNKSIDSDNNTITNIANADIKSSAGLEFSKMENLTASRALVSDSNGDVSVSAVTATELSYLDGVTSAIQTQLNNIADIAHPIGSIFQTVHNYADSAAVVAAIGGTTWVRFAEGKVMVGYDASDTDFDTAEETGGAKTHTLTEAQLPAHRHFLFRNVGVGNIGDTTASLSAAHFYADGSQSYRIRKSSATNAFLEPDITLSGQTGSGSAHNNLQPYVVVYMWKRTA